MERSEGGRRAIEETLRAGNEMIVQLTQGELQRMMEEASRNAILVYERRTQPVENETTRRRVVRERKTERVSEGMSRRAPERRRAIAPSEVGSSSQIGWRRREPAISRADVDSVDLPKYDGLKDPQEHVSALDLVMNLYRQTDSIKAKLFVTTLTGKAQEWFTSLPAGSIESHEQLVQDLRIDMMVSILIHGLKKRPFTSALARDPPTNVEQLMRLAQKYINEEEMNAMKDGEWLGAGRTRDHESGKDLKQNTDRTREPPYRPKYHRYTPLNTTRTKALLTVEKSDMLKWPRHTRFTAS
ncbi:UNVERIFIED_CONTAM: hypothetical protein Sindi_2681500 [Sesamum indicum]